jgi:sugar phosphate isomerase/epimerase
MPVQTLAATRRQFLAGSIAAASGLCVPTAATEESSAWKPRYMLASCMYGTFSIEEILQQIEPAGAEAVDIWPKVHGNQREQLSEMGEQAFAQLLEKYQTQIGCLTQYPLGPFGLQQEMQLAARLGAKTLVTGARGPKGLKGTEEKAAVREFVKQLEPHLAVAREAGVTLAIENHANSLIESPDSIRWLAEFSPGPELQIAFAPYHLMQDTELLCGLLRECHHRTAVFYAWQHGMGCHQKLPKEQELLQMPGRGELDFAPIWKTLRQVNFLGWTEIFMHPVPRGIPILPTAGEVTEEINRARAYLAGLNG